MKVRWTPRSLRLRITPSELAALEGGEPVVEALELPGGGWRVRLGPAEQTGLTGEGGEFALGLSAADLERLTQPEAEGVYFETGGAAPVRYYVEKDFPCAHPRPAEAQEPHAETFARGETG